VRLRLDLDLPTGPLLVRLDSTATGWGLMGPSGSGKTSLLRTLAGIDQHARGVVEVDGESWLSANARMTPWARRVGWAPQEGLLFPHLSVRENLLIGHDAARAGPNLPQVAEALEIEALLPRQPRHLSGGERQRVALGRALLASPRLLLLDEPFSALDRPLRERVIEGVRRVRAEWCIPAIIVSHDAQDLRSLVDVWWEVSGGAVQERKSA
jgi:molybdate transport system ATP-binding protein